MTTAPPTPGFARRTDGAPAVHADMSERGNPAGPGAGPGRPRAADPPTDPAAGQ
ncbi:MAG: hypothetical protein V7637_4000 [Mycobacteriales bacterium]